jgi:hypothetical protein
MQAQHASARRQVNTAQFRRLAGRSPGLRKLLRLVGRSAKTPAIASLWQRKHLRSLVLTTKTPGHTCLADAKFLAKSSTIKCQGS